MITFLAVVWGGLGASLVGAFARNVGVKSRSRELAACADRTPRRVRGSAALRGLPGVAGWMERRDHHRTARKLGRELPITVELFRVAVSAGLTAPEAVRVVSNVAPVLSAQWLRRVDAAFRSGRPFASVASDVSLRAPALAPVLDVLASSATLGTAAEAPLARLGSELRAEVRRAAESRARTVPVRLLFPLVFLVLPAFGLLGIVPSVLAGFGN